MTIHQQKRRATSKLGVIAFLAVAALPAYSEQPGPIPEPPLEDPADSLSVTAQELEQLEALGYIDASPTPADVSKSGVVLWDRERSHPGYTLYFCFLNSSSPYFPLLYDARQADLNKLFVCARYPTHNPAKTSPVPPFVIAAFPVLL